MRNGEFEEEYFDEEESKEEEEETEDEDDSEYSLEEAAFLKGYEEAGLIDKEEETPDKEKKGNKASKSSKD